MKGVVSEVHLSMKHAMRTRFCMCGCYYTHNLFIKKYEMHVKFVNEEQFLKDYKQVSRGQQVHCYSVKHHTRYG